MRQPRNEEPAEDDLGGQRDGVHFESTRSLAYWNRVKFDFSRPGKPTDNPFIEAFNGSLRRECLSQHWFVDLDDAQRTLHRWKDEYNNVRPHSSLDDQAPAHFGGGGHFIPTPNRLGFSPS